MSRLRAVLVAIAIAMLGCAITACTSSSSTSPSSSTPPLCSAVAQLKTSVKNMTQIDLNANALNKLRSDLNTVQANVQTVSREAKSHYSSDMSQVRASTAAAQTAASNAKNSPSASTLAAVGTAVTTLASDVAALANAVKSSC